ncbi:unnamed protein product [Lactuca virosa]|uniref:glutamate--tRNA ligase n=1 Tax=Lactuca virosa TaxID=75947 RepID=A0AAU9LCH5_9ASTR|nr:unnamed protein product [Lactuca virosa]
MELLIAADSTPPLSVLATAEVAGVSLTVNPTLTVGSPPILVLTNRLKLRGTNVLVKYLGRTSTTIPNLYERDAFETRLMSGWSMPLSCLVVQNMRAHANIAIWSYLAGAGKRWESLLKSKKYQNLGRWYTMISTQHAAVTSASLKKKEHNCSTNVKHDNDSNRPEADLPYAELGKILLRFAPEPSGYLHIGHAKAVLLNQYFAQKYKGKLFLRFDDTNPAKESNEFVDNILRDIGTLGIKYEKITYTSDYFSNLMEMAEKFIKEGKAYVDDTPKEQMKYEREKKIESKCRNQSVDENLKLWNEMVLGTEKGVQCCLRGKLEMGSKNGSMRDPVYYRCNPIPHHRIGSKYKIYPTYDFACPFVDSIEGITHALRSSEYHDRNPQYSRIQEDMGVRKVHLYEFSRLNMVYTVLSKRKLLWFVENNKVDGWDDARFPTVQGIVRRGLQIQALIHFILDQGASKNLNLMEWDKLWNINKKMIDPVCPRHTANP